MTVLLERLRTEHLDQFDGDELSDELMRRRFELATLIEAAQEARRWMATDDRYGRFAAAKFDQALAPFVEREADNVA